MTPTTLISARARRVSEFQLGDLLAAGKGVNVLDLALGVPELPSNAELRAAACSEIARDANQYADPVGMPALRQAIAAHCLTGAEAHDALDRITVTVGTTEGLLAALLSMIDEGDEVLLFEPFYENHLRAIQLAGGVCRLVPLRGPAWRVTESQLAAAIGPQTRAVVLNSPHNPTGAVLDSDELGAIARCCERANLAVICDETYREFVYDGARHVSPAAVPGLCERSIVLRSFSKSCLVSGWRVGYALTPRSLGAAFRTAHVTMTCGASAPLQAALAATLPALLRESVEICNLYQRQRDRVVNALAACGFRCHAPPGGIFFLCHTPDDERDEVAFARRLLAETGIKVVPAGAFFGRPEGGGGLVRVCFAKSDPTLDEAERRLARFAQRRIDPTHEAESCVI